MVAGDTLSDQLSGVPDIPENTKRYLYLAIDVSNAYSYPHLLKQWYAKGLIGQEMPDSSIYRFRRLKTAIFLNKFDISV
jgi:hypothetical protein